MAIRRIVFNIASVGLMILAICISGLWIRSYFAQDLFGRHVWSGDGFNGRMQDYYVTSNIGKLYVGINRDKYHHELDARPSDASGWRHISTLPDPNMPAPFFMWPAVNYPNYHIEQSAWDCKVMLLGRFHQHIVSGSDWTDREHLGVLLPHWLALAIVLLLLLFPLFRVLAVLKARRRVQRGQCFACGYDVRAAPQRCSECGQDDPLSPRPRVGYKTRPVLAEN